MRIHSNTLTRQDFHKARNKCIETGKVGTAVHLAVNTSHGSRKRRVATEVQLGSVSSASFTAAGLKEGGYTAEAVKRASRRRPRNGYGQRDENYPYAPTWHEYGHFIAALFAIDPEAIIGEYDGVQDFEYKTGFDRPWNVVDYAVDRNARAYDFMGDAL